MKELIPPASDIGVLFSFDPPRTGILLIGGNKGGEWNAWYDRMVPVADDLFDEHLRELEREGADVELLISVGGEPGPLLGL